MTWRPSSVAPRAMTCAASCTPWPPKPVIRSSRSTETSEGELLQMVDVVARRLLPGDERVVHAPDGEVVDGVGVTLRVAAGFGNGCAQRTHDKLTGASDLLRKMIREAGGA